MNINERRRAPRFSVSLEATLKTPDNFSCAISVFNISSSGLKFSIPHSEIPRLLPNNSQENRLTPISIEISVSLQIDTDEKPPISKINCGVVYVQRESLDICAVGCRFEVFYGDASLQLEQYINMRASQLVE